MPYILEMFRRHFLALLFTDALIFNAHYVCLITRLNNEEFALNAPQDSKQFSKDVSEVVGMQEEMQMRLAMMGTLELETVVRTYAKQKQVMNAFCFLQFVKNFAQTTF